ncbi:MAG: hypothetical protein EU539_10275 [Promethearchaeota archaeon]|nr:MAG: hypothetical protein EU539_10275 [Candidatus Lokiarchaeota archaeon]
MMAEKRISSKEIAEYFGLKSQIFNESINYLQKMASTTSEEAFNKSYDDWKEIFEKIFGKKILKRSLFIKQSYLALILKAIITIKISRIKDNVPETSHNAWKSQELAFLNSSELKLFYWTYFNNDLFAKIHDCLGNKHFASEDLFFDLYQQIFLSNTRHKSGEFYTPTNLVDAMVKAYYEIGLKVLDPSCGSGNFIINIIIKILNSENEKKTKWEAIHQIFGFDINPLAVITVKTNILLILLEYFKISHDDLPSINIFLIDSLFPEGPEVKTNFNPRELYNSFDLVIGNPPWLTYKDVDQRLKKRMKEISNEFDINPGAKNITNIEEAVIFLFKIPQLFLKKGSRIGFVMPRSLLVSSQNEKVRRFDYFKNIEIYEFNDLVFNIECCCIFATYHADGITEIESAISKYPIKSHYLDHYSMEEIEIRELVPFAFFQKKPGKKLLVKKLITTQKKQRLLPIHLSDYINEFIQGADLIPKSLLLCEIESTLQDGKLSIIEPWISPQAKGVWKKGYFKKVKVESENLFKTSLSRGLYPFFIQLYDTFLPLDSNFEYNPNKMGPFSRKHWNHISKIYNKEKNKDLFKVGINYRNKLCTGKKVRETQLAAIKVVFPNAKNLMSAVIKDPSGRSFIDSTLYYYSTDDEDEAYYICGMLNIKRLFKTVKTIADTRHHHKRPLYFNIKRYKGTAKQKRIAFLSKKCSSIVEEHIKNSKNISNDEIYELIEKPLKEIMDIGEKILLSAEEQRIIREYEFD